MTERMPHSRAAPSAPLSWPRRGAGGEVCRRWLVTLGALTGFALTMTVNGPVSEDLAGAVLERFTIHVYPADTLEDGAPVDRFAVVPMER